MHYLISGLHSHEIVQLAITELVIYSKTSKIGT